MSLRTPGFTLMEMMVVMVITAMLLGFGIGIYSGMGKGLSARAVLRGVRSAITRTRNFARKEGCDSFLKLDAGANQICGMGRRTVGLWHFEDDLTTGAFGLNGTVLGGELVPHGAVGNCLDFGEEGGMVDCGGSPVFVPIDGIVVEAYVFIQEHGEKSIVEKRGSYSLATTQDGNLEGAIWVGEYGERVQVTGEGAVLPLSRWIQVAMVYDEAELVVSVEGIVRGRVRESRKLSPSVDANLTVGSENRPFRGRIDEVKVSTLVADSALSLPQEASLLGESRRIVFNSAGWLHPEYHRGPATLCIQTPSGLKRLTVGILGLVKEEEMEE